MCTWYLPIICIISVSLVPWQALQGPSNPEQASSRLLGGQTLVLYTIIITYCTSKIRRKSQINLGVRNEKLQDEQKDKTKREYIQKPSVKDDDNVLLYLVFKKPLTIPHGQQI